MKVLIATGIYPPDIGGPATYSLKLREEFIRRGHEVIVVTYYSQLAITRASVNHPERGEASCRLFKISRKWPLPRRYFIYTMFTIFYGAKADLIYAQDSVSAGLPAMLVNLILRTPFVLKVVGDYAWEQYQVKKEKRKKKKEAETGERLLSLDEFLNTKPGGKTRILWMIERVVAKHARKIIVPSNYLKGVVQKWGIPSSKIEVIYNSFDVSQLPQFHSTNHETNENVVIISAGRLVPWKGFDTLIEVVADLIKEKPNLELVIYGDGPERENLELRIKNLGIQNKVKLLGRIEHENLLEKLQGGRKFFVLNSSYEGMSHQILECQALRVPCAVSRVGGNPEIVEDGKTGLLFEYNDKEQIKSAILRLLDDAELVHKIKERAYQQIIERHDFNKMTEQTINTLRSVL